MARRTRGEEDTEWRAWKQGVLLMQPYGQVYASSIDITFVLGGFRYYLFHWYATRSQPPHPAGHVLVTCWSRANV